MLRTPAKLRGVCGIYGVIHRESGRVYVGQSRNVMNRRIRHRKEAKDGSQSHFHCALRKYGEDAFDFEILEECAPELLTEREHFYIRLMDAVKSGFNLASTPSRSRFGVPFTDEQKAKISRSLAGKKRKPFTEEHIAQMREIGRNRVYSPELRAKLSALFKGAKRDPEEVRLRALKQRKPIIQMDMNGNRVAEFSSPIEAAVAIGVRPSTIRSAANGSSPHAYGFKWAYQKT